MTVNRTDAAIARVSYTTVWPFLDLLVQVMAGHIIDDRSKRGVGGVMRSVWAGRPRSIGVIGRVASTVWLISATPC